MTGLARLILVVALGVFSSGVSRIVLANDASEYHLGPGDEIRVEIFGEEKHEFKIGVTGEISYPRLGSINVKHKTTEQVRRILLQGLGGRIFKSPQIVVTILRYRPYFIQGAVKTPGAYPYEPGLTMEMAVAVAGGYTELARKDKVFVAREGRPKAAPQVIDVGSAVQAGDTITIPAVFTCFVCESGIPGQEDAYGFVVGSSIFYPDLELRLAFDDNIFSDADEVQSDSIIFLAPQGTLASGTDNAFYSLSYGGLYGFFRDSSEDDFDDHDINGQAKFLLDSKNQLDLHARIMRGHDRRGTDLTESQPNALAAPPVWNFGQADALWRLGTSDTAGRIELYAEYATKRYQNFRDVLAQRDVDQLTVQPRVFYEIRSATSVFLDARRTTIDYPNADIDSVETEYLLGVTWSALAKTEGSVGVGVLSKDFDQPDRGDRSFGTWQASVTWLPRTYSEIKLFFSRKPKEPTRNTDTFQLNTAVEVSWTHEWTDRLETVLSAGFLRAERQGVAPREDDVRTVGFNVDYKFKRWLHLNAGYTFRERDSTDSAFAFDKQIVYLGLSVTP